MRPGAAGGRRAALVWLAAPTAGGQGHEWSELAGVEEVTRP
jgi:hypothetical protein